MENPESNMQISSELTNVTQDLTPKKPNSIDISHIFIKDHHLDSNYCWIKYGPFTLLLMKEPQMINITKLDLNDKLVTEWVRNKKTQRRIDFYNKKYKNEQNLPYRRILLCERKALDVIKNVRYEFRGTYITFDLLLDFGDWVSDDFHDACKDIVNQYLTFQKDTLIKKLENDEMAFQKDIEMKNKEIYELETKNVLLQGYLSDEEKKHRDTKIKMIEHKTKREEAEETIERKNITININKLSIEGLEERHVPLEISKNKKEVFKVTLSIDAENKNVLKMQSCQKKSLKKLEEGEKLIWQKLTTNAINIKNRIVDKLKKEYLGSFSNSNTKFTTRRKIDTEKIKKVIEREHNRIDTNMFTYIKKIIN